MEYELAPNPYQKDENGKWYWNDETGLEEGPYDSEGAAKADLDRYCKEFLGG